MPQEFQVLQCYNCNVFQVEIVKKKPKWECKICHEKQFIKQVFLRGTSKDCRLLVQDCNEKRLSLDETPNFNNAVFMPGHGNTVEPSESKWSEFIPRQSEQHISGSEQVPMGDYTFELPAKRRKTRRASDDHMEAEIKERGSSNEHVMILQHTTDEDEYSTSNCQFANLSVVSTSVEQQNLEHQCKVWEVDKSQETDGSEYQSARKEHISQSSPNSNFQSANGGRHDAPGKGCSITSHCVFEEDNFDFSDDFLF